MIIEIIIIFINYIENFVDYIKLMKTKENLWFIKNLVK